MIVPTVRIDADQAGRNRLLHDWDGPAGKKLVRTLNQITTRTKQNITTRKHVVTGLMRSRTEYRLLPGSPLVGEVVVGTNYARWVHDGTRYIQGDPFLTDAVRSVIGTGF